MFVKTSPSKRSAASSVASHGDSSVYFTPTESMCEPGNGAATSQPKFSFPSTSQSKEAESEVMRADIVEGEASRPVKSSLGSLVDLRDFDKLITASTMCLAGSYGSTNTAFTLPDRDVLKERLDEVDQKSSTLQNLHKSLSRRNEGSLTPSEIVLLKGLASQRRSKSSSATRPSVCKREGGSFHNLIPQIYVHDMSHTGDGGSSTGFLSALQQGNERREKTGEVMNWKIASKSTAFKTCNNKSRLNKTDNGPCSITSTARSYEEHQTNDYTVIEKRAQNQTMPARLRVSNPFITTPMQNLFTQSRRTGSFVHKLPHKSPTGKRQKPVIDIDKILSPKSNQDLSVEYRSVLSGEYVHQTSLECAAFHGTALTYTAKLLRTMCLAYAYFIVGLCVSSLGPSLLDLSDHTGVEPGNVYQLVTARGAGVTAGTVLLGLVIHTVDNYLSFSAVLGLCGVANILFSLVHHYVVLLIDQFIVGLCLGFLETGIQILCVDIWSYKNPPFMLSIHFVYGVGTIAGPLITQPLLSDGNLTRASSTDENSVFNNISQSTPHNTSFNSSAGVTSAWSDDERPLVDFTSPQALFRIVYVIIGGLFLSCAALKLIIFMSNTQLKWRQKISDRKCMKRISRDSEEVIKPDTVTLFTMVITFMFLQTGVESIYKNYLAAYSVTSLGWRRAYGAWVTAAVYTSTTVGRGVGMIIGAGLDPGVFIWLNLLLMFATFLVELLMVYKNSFVLCITASLQGLGQSTVLPACFIWANTRLNLHGTNAGVVMFTSSLGLIAAPGITGWLMSTYSGKFFHIIPLAAVSLNLLILCLMSLIAHGVSGEKTSPDHHSTSMFDQDQDRVDFIDKNSRDENGNYMKETTTSTRLSAYEFSKHHITPRRDSKQPHNSSLLTRESEKLTSPVQDQLSIAPQLKTPRPAHGNHCNLNSSSRSSSKVKSPIFNSLQLHPSFTGSPQTYKVCNRSFGSDVLSEIKSLSGQRREGQDRSLSAFNANNKNVLSKQFGAVDLMKSPVPTAKKLFLLKSPYSMNSLTPLALITFAKRDQLDH